MFEETGVYAQGIANTLLTSQLGEAELLLAGAVALFLIVFLLRGRDPDYHGRDWHPGHS